MGISDFMESGENYDNMLIKRSYTIKVVLLYHLNEALGQPHILPFESSLKLMIIKETVKENLDRRNIKGGRFINCLISI